MRQSQAKPVFEDLETWLNAQLTRISGKSPLAEAIRYGLTRMKKARPYLDHGFLEAYTLIETSKLNNVDPQVWLTWVLDQIADHKTTRINELLPWHFAAREA